ncbi:Unconventional myosin-Va [Phytophthora fragariae]|uniref:Unconventional myosin-Va n=1 Tax=Phytophthora fragariae TaxID=53985 RepID=A0A6A3EAI8_9STRA|nr:Unconventional myosin-Va [Phytophthora fragariae]KAE8929493.1 Unconventional myosin-Va [Phytophthora fragariae]KAE8990734.1 Unconventional myosin-Va [Phytophthora fragariae]KAE9089647.1 Unconventional myosin-Va [Phytophthora fragariae]KAE9090128.1 Unconventional myosin-Va [Phytophthora fragariae]
MEGIKVYTPDPEHVWLPGVICGTTGDGKQLTVRLDEVVGPRDAAALERIESERELKALAGAQRAVDLTDAAVLEALSAKNTSVESGDNKPSLPLQNTSESANGFEDMILIDHLHEASILYNLRRRFFRQLPYTYTGRICIAVNPYQWLDLYSKPTMDKFSDGKRENKPPHVYAVSMEAFFNMRQKQENQSILVSGESGAGKTETTKIVMSHLAALATNANSKVIQQIIQANPLLESFGNAKTVRNDNSSRFGKFTELQFTIEGQLIGARSRTYLLEKSRVTTQAQGERNFHIFYQLLAQRAQFPELELDALDEFKYVSTRADAPGGDEEGDLSRTRQALEVVGIAQPLQQEIMQVLAAVLHLGETDFTTRDGDVDASQLVDTKHFAVACRLLGVEVDALERAVCNRNVFVGREVILKPMTQDQAADCRDALAKSLYSKLFLWLVEQINETIGVKTKSAGSFIGILDIFGFEHFETNSFEQFCINYANEKLQQKFVQDVLKTVQIEYEEENITWSHITFADNQDVLNLIEGRLGVISFLNEESLLATGTDASFASKLGAVMENNPLLETPRLNKCAFSIYHYAGKVTYDASGFLDKHRDAILPDIKQCMSKSKLKILSKMFTDDVNASSASTSAAPTARGRLRSSNKKGGHAQTRRTTVGTQFKESLSQLMEKIGLTEVHYVRCLKPNPLKSANCFSHGDIVSQLRCAGVIEAIRVSRSAYPSRMPHLECIKKFRVLLTGAVPTQGKFISESDADIKAKCEELMDKLLPGRNIQDYQVGLTRVYFREGVLEELETKRGWALRKYAIVLQKNVRCWLMRRLFLRQKQQIVVIQKYWRRYVVHKRHLTLRRGVVLLQAQVRGMSARKMYRVLKFDYRIVRFQAYCRMHTERQRYLKKLAAVRRLQGFFRFSLLRLVFLRKMEKEKAYKELGSKVAQLQMKLDRKQVHTGAKMSPSGKNRSPSPSDTPHASGSGSERGTSSSSSTRGSMLNSRFSGTSGILDESHEVITALHEENEKLRQQLEKQEAEIQRLKTENRTLKNWQQSKEVGEQVQKLAHRDQESKDLTYLAAIEAEYEKLRSYICETRELPTDIGSITQASQAPPATGGRGSLTSLSSEKSLLATAAANGIMDQKSAEAHHLLLKSAARIAHAKSKVSSKGNARRVKDHWEEIRNYPPPMHYSLGSVPWKRLLTDWAQGNPKKLDYMTRWLKNVLDGGPIVSDTFPMGVELKYVTPMMLDGFMQLVIPKLAERPDIQVHVHTKEFIGTSMRITLSQLEHQGSQRSTSGHPRVERSRPMEVEDFQRISILANSNSRNSSSRMSASTLSLSPMESSSAMSSGSPSSYRSSIFRSGRSNHSGEHNPRNSFFHRNK